MAPVERPGRHHAALSRCSGRGLFRTQAARLGLGLVLGAGCLYLAARDVAFAETVCLLRQANLGWVGLALLVVLITALAKILRWGVLLGPQTWRENRRQITNAFLSAQLLNSVLPVRIGEVSRVIVIAEPQPGTPEKITNASLGFDPAGVAVAGEAVRPAPPAGYATVVGSLVLEKIFDMLAYSLLIISGLALIVWPAWLAGPALLWLLSTLLAGLVLAGLLFFRQPAAGLLDRWAGRLPVRYAGWVQQQLHLGFASLDALVLPGRLLAVCACTGLIWALALLVNQLAALALGMTLPWPVVIVLLVALQIGIWLPSLPAGVGVFEFVCVWVLQYFEIAQPGALSYGILLHIIVYLPIIILGAVSLVFLPASVRSRTS